MATKVISRAQWHARPPTDTVKLDWSKVVYFFVHYSGESRDQSVRSIQDWCMNGKGHSDIDYNELIRGNNLYVGRGDNVGGHTLGHNSVGYGVCIIGRDGDATPDDLRVLQERYQYACDRAGRVLTIRGHKEAPGQKPTQCPGSEILGWIHAGLVDDRPAEPVPTTPENWTEKHVNNLPEARLGHHNAKTVKTIQGLVNRDLGNVLLEDGTWGPRTDNAVREWQKRNNVPNSVRSDGTGDGVFGRACWTFALTLV